MSQEKVDAYKKEKANRKKAMESAKNKKLIYRITGGIITVLIAAWLVCSIGWKYFDWYNPFARQETTRALSADELASIRNALGLDADGNPVTTTSGDNTTASDDSTTTDGDNTTTDGDNTVASDDNTVASGDSTTSHEDTTTEAK